MTMPQTSIAAPALPAAALPSAGLPSFEVGGRTFFTHRAETLVMQACWVRGIAFDLFAARFNVPRATLLEILRGNEPVTTQTRRILEDFVARELGPGTRPGNLAFLGASRRSAAAQGKRL